MMTLLELVHVVSPGAVERAYRLEYAVNLLQAGRYSLREISGMVQRRFDCSQATAWRIVDMANDVAGEIER